MWRYTSRYISTYTMKLALLIICSLVLPLAHAEALLAQVETTVSEEAISEETVPEEVIAPNMSAAVRAGTKKQIFLDQRQFGPGIIDGRPGRFTKLAIKNYNTSLGREADDPLALEEIAASTIEPYAMVTVPENVDKYINAELPTKLELQAESHYMSYRSVLEFMSERYHASQGLLIELNGKKGAYGAKAGSSMIVPNVAPFKIEDLKSGRSYKKEENLTARRVVIDTDIKQIYIYELKSSVQDDQSTKVTPVLTASFPITHGKSQFIPKGFWNLMNSIEMPTWRYDKLLLETGVRGEESLNIPSGPNNPVGVIWNGLSKSGIGIHGTNSPNTIGRSRSSGCIRLANWDAVRIPHLVRPGAIVEIK